MLEASPNFVEQSSKNLTDNKDGPINLRNLNETSCLNVGAEQRRIHAAARTKTPNRCSGKNKDRNNKNKRKQIGARQHPLHHFKQQDRASSIKKWPALTKIPQWKLTKTEEGKIPEERRRQPYRRKDRRRSEKRQEVGRGGEKVRKPRNTHKIQYSITVLNMISLNCKSSKGGTLLLKLISKLFSFMHTIRMYIHIIKNIFNYYLNIVNFNWYDCWMRCERFSFMFGGSGRRCFRSTLFCRPPSSVAVFCVASVVLDEIQTWVTTCWKSFCERRNTFEWSSYGFHVSICWQERFWFWACSVKYGVWGVEFRVPNMECGVLSVECGVLSVECGVWSAECEVQSVECRI